LIAHNVPGHDGQIVLACGGGDKTVRHRHGATKPFVFRFLLPPNYGDGVVEVEDSSVQAFDESLEPFLKSHLAPALQSFNPGSYLTYDVGTGVNAVGIIAKPIQNP